MIIYNLVLLMLVVTLSECHDYQHHQHHHHGRTGHNIKSYGGYFPGSVGQNEAANEFLNSQNYHNPQISSYQPYGWNFNQPRRTYGGVNHQHSAPQYPPNHVGWANNNLNTYSALNPFPFFPTLPNFFNFPQFPNAFPYGGGYPQGNQNNLNRGSVYAQHGPGAGHNVNNQGVPATNNQGQLPYPTNNINPGFPTVPTGQPTYPQNNVNQGGQNVPTGRPTYPQNNVNQGGQNVPTGRPTYPQNNINQGIPLPPGQATHPQNNVNQGVPAGNVNKNTGIAGNLQPGQGQLPYPQNRPVDQNPGTSTNQGQLPYPNVNQGISNVDRNQYQGGVAPRPPPTIGNPGSTGQGTLTYPQNNVNQGIPTGNGNRNQGGSSNVNSGLGRFPIVPSNTNKLNTGDGDVQQVISPDTPKPGQVDSTGIDVRYTENRPGNRISGTDSVPTETKEREFASNAFFGMNENRQWTNEDELKWLATTKAPYFENKVPGLECTLPAAAVLGAKDAFKVASLLPLNIPPGKPILSCNATNLLQSQIRLDGKVYDCDNSDVILSCPSHGGTVDECEGQKLQCDLRGYNSNPIWCTNGTIVSSDHIVCESASLMPSKSVLNCYFRSPIQPGIRQNIPTSTKAPTANILPVLPLPSTNVNERNEDEEDFGSIEIETLGETDLMPQVKNAMKNVFPHDLLTMPSTKYLPQKASMQPIDPNLKDHINGVFNVKLLAHSQNENEVDNLPSSTLNQGEVHTGRAHAQPNANWNFRNSGIKDGIKAIPETRFGGAERQHQNLHDRLIFTD